MSSLCLDESRRISWNKRVFAFVFNLSIAALHVILVSAVNNLNQLYAPPLPSLHPTVGITEAGAELLCYIEIARKGVLGKALKHVGDDLEG